MNTPHRSTASVNHNYKRIARIVREYAISLRLLRDICETKLEKTQRRHHKIHRQRAHQLAVIEFVYDKIETFRYQAAAELAQECRLDELFQSYAWLNPEMLARHYRFVEEVAGEQRR